MSYISCSLRIGLLVFLAVFSGRVVAGGTTIDASSQETFKSSISTIKAGLTETKRKEFESALMRLMFSGVDFESGGLMALARIGGDPEALEDMQKEIMRKIDGMTANEVIVLAQEANSEIEKRRIRKLEREVAELEARIEGIETKKAILSKFVTSNERFRWRKSGYMESPLIELDVTNNAGFAVSRVYCQGVVYTPGRAVPWIDEEFNFRVPGGIEPGETREFSLAPNQFGEWGNAGAKERNDTVFTVTITNVEDAAGEKVLSYEDQSAEKELGVLKERLAKLRSKYVN